MYSNTYDECDTVWGFVNISWPAQRKTWWSLNTDWGEKREKLLGCANLIGWEADTSWMTCHIENKITKKHIDATIVPHEATLYRCLISGHQGNCASCVCCARDHMCICSKIYTSLCLKFITFLDNIFEHESNIEKNELKRANIIFHGFV